MYRENYSKHFRHIWKHSVFGGPCFCSWSSRERKTETTYIDTVKSDTGAFEACEIAALMADKRLWKDLVVARLRATK